MALYVQSHPLDLNNRMERREKKVNVTVVCAGEIRCFSREIIILESSVFRTLEIVPPLLRIGKFFIFYDSLELSIFVCANFTELAKGTTVSGKCLCDRIMRIGNEMREMCAPAGADENLEQNRQHHGGV